MPRPRKKVVLVVSPGVLRILTRYARKRRVLGRNQSVESIWEYRAVGEPRLILKTKGVKRAGRRSSQPVLPEPEVGVPEVGVEGAGLCSPVEP